MGDLEVVPDDRRHPAVRMVSTVTGVVRLVPPAIGVARRVVRLVATGGQRLGAIGRPTMRVLVGDQDVPLDAGRLADAFPDATSYVVILVPGRDGSSPEIVAEGTHTLVSLRYDPGRHISESGRYLAELLTGLVAAWPVEVERLALIGYSTGGLVARSAVLQADESWLPLVQDVFCVAGALSWALRETAPSGEPASTELWQGYLDEREWVAIEPAEVLAERRTGVRGSPTGRESRTRSGSRAGRWVGDLLVLPDTARPSAVPRWVRWLRRVSWRGTGNGSR